MTPAIPGSNPIFCPPWLAVLVVWQCPQNEGPVFGKKTLIEEMIEHLLLIWVWGNFAPPSLYPATLQYLGKTIQILSM
jgi:hypothetical protein